MSLCSAPIKTMAVFGTGGCTCGWDGGLGRAVKGWGFDRSASPWQGLKLRLTGHQCNQKLSACDLIFRIGHQQVNQVSSGDWLT